MSFISRYKMNSNRYSLTNEEKIDSNEEFVKCNLSNENLTNFNRNPISFQNDSDDVTTTLMGKKSKSIIEIESYNEIRNEKKNENIELESSNSLTDTINSRYNENIVLFQSIKEGKMKNKEKKRHSKSASSLLRRFFTCGGVVTSCSGNNKNNQSSSDSRRSSKSGYMEMQIPAIILTQPESDENLAKSINSLNNLKNKEHKIISVSDPSLSNVKIDLSDDQEVPIDRKIILPIIKLNDDLMNGDEEVRDEDIDESDEDEDNVNEILDNFVDEYSEDDEEEEEDSAKIGDENSFANNITSIIIEEADEIYLDETQVFEEDCSNEKDIKTTGNLSSTTIPSFSFELHSDDQEKSESSNLLNKSDDVPENESEANNQSEKKSKNSTSSKMVNHYSKFLTANNILTERGCLVNIRTGSFNLGCQQSATSSSSLSQDKYLNDEELIDSHEFFNSLQSDCNDFKNSASDYSFKNSASFNSSLDNSALNLLVPFLLIQNRRKNSGLGLLDDTKKLNKNDSNENLSDKNLISESSDYSLKISNISSKNSNSHIQQSVSINSNLLTASLSPPNTGEQDQTRRCSHDPNIEKLHKNYIENVKLASSKPFSSNINMDSITSISKNESNNDSQASLTSQYLKNTLKSFKFNENFMSLDSGNKLNKDINYYFSSNEDKIEMESEKSDILNEIFKVDKWLRDNRNNHQNSFKKDLSKRINNKLPSMTISEDEDGQKLIDSCNNFSNKNNMNFYEDENDDNDVKNKYSTEINDSAIDVRSYGSISTLSKASSSKSRVNWQSFSKYYHYYFFQSMNTTWSKYQIAAMSLEQLMALRKLALIQFSKLVERQHSTMIRTFRLFSKKNAANEFQRVYDSIDSANTTKSKSKINQNTNSTNSSIINSNLSFQNQNKDTQIFIGNRKVSNHLGAKFGHHLSNELIHGNKKKRNRNSIKKLEKALSTSNDYSIMNDEPSVSSTHGEFDSLPVELADQSIGKGKKELVFGLPLSSIMQLSGQPLPQPILESMRFIRKISPTEVGVFRKNGNKNRINKLKEQIDNNEPINFLSSDINVFDIADTLKLYFRELPECLITNKLSDILLSNYSRIRPEERKTTLQQVMLLIPDENRLVLQTLLLFLNDIAKHHKVNQMNRNNLAVIFSPVIFSMNFDYKSKKSKNLKNITTIPVNFNLTKTSAVFNNDDLNQVDTQDQLKEDEIKKISLEPEDSERCENSDKFTLDVKQTDLKRNSTTFIDSKSDQLLSAQPQSRLLSVPNAHLAISSTSSSDFLTTCNQPTNVDLNSNVLNIIKQNSKRKQYSNRFNKAASSLVSFGVDFGSNKTSSFFSDSIKDSLENLDYMNKVVQLCVSDMIKYSMDLFTVPVENFEKLKLSVSYGSEPYNLDYFYDLEFKKMKRTEFFTNNVKIEKTNWFYFDKFEDVSIYYFRSDSNSLKNLDNQTTNINQSNLNIATNQTTHIGSNQTSNQTSFQNSKPSDNATNNFETINSTFLIPQKNESFNDKLKLWKCCTLVKHQNLTLDQILNRIKNERHLWDDDFREGKVIEKLDDQTELYRYIILFMPPHPSRDFFEIRHNSLQDRENNTLILTSTSVKHVAGNKLVGDIRSNLIISKYVIEKLISTDTTTTFKITHYIKMDYKGFTLEFYNKTFGYMMARLLYNLKMSLLNTN